MHLVFFSDVYGFSALVKEDIERVGNNIQKLHTELQRISHNFHEEGLIHKYFVLSDNILASTELPRDDSVVQNIELFVQFCSDVYEASLRCDLPLRGCLTVGEAIITDNVILGRPVIEAVEFESHINLPLLFIPKKVVSSLKALFIEHENTFNQIFHTSYDLAYRDGIVGCYILQPDNKQELIELADKLYAQYSASLNTPKPALAWKIVAGLLRQNQSQEG